MRIGLWRQDPAVHWYVDGTGEVSAKVKHDLQIFWQRVSAVQQSARE